MAEQHHRPDQNDQGGHGDRRRVADPSRHRSWLIRQAAVDRAAWRRPSVRGVDGTLDRRNEAVAPSRHRLDEAWRVG